MTARQSVAFWSFGALPFMWGFAPVIAYFFFQTDIAGLAASLVVGAVWMLPPVGTARRAVMWTTFAWKDWALAIIASVGMILIGQTIAILLVGFPQ